MEQKNIIGSLSFAQLARKKRKTMHRNDEELNKVIHEQILKECWHVPVGATINGVGMSKCEKCRLIKGAPEWLRRLNPDYLLDPAAYWRLLQKVKEHENFRAFLFQHLNITFEPATTIETLLDQQRGCEAIAEFFVPEWTK